MAYRAEALDMLPEVESFAAKVLADDGLQEVDLAARRLLANKDHHIHPFVMDADITWTIGGQTQ
jgi:hypothetical protein